MMIDLSHASGHRALSRSLCTDAGRSPESPHSGVSGRFRVGVSGVTLGGGQSISIAVRDFQLLSLINSDGHRISYHLI